MPLQSILESLERIEIVVPSSNDPLQAFADVAALYDNRRVELTEEGHIIVMPPVGMDGSYRNGEAFGQLREWAKKNGTGKAFDSSAGFYLTPRENRSPSAAWVSNDRIEPIPKASREKFALFCPNFAIEIKTPSSTMAELRAKCERYVQHGAFEAWLINPEDKTVEIYRYRRAEALPKLLRSTAVTGSGPLSTFVLDLTEIWSGT